MWCLAERADGRPQVRDDPPVAPVIDVVEASSGWQSSPRDFWIRARLSRRCLAGGTASGAARHRLEPLDECPNRSVLVPARGRGRGSNHRGPCRRSPTGEDRDHLLVMAMQRVGDLWWQRRLPLRPPFEGSLVSAIVGSARQSLAGGLLPPLFNRSGR